MTNDHLILPQCAYYAPTPMLTVDESECIVDYNLALQVLLGADVDGCRYQPLSGLLNKVAPCVTGTLFPTLSRPQESKRGSGKSASQSECAHEIRSTACCYATALYGPVNLRAAAVCHIDASSGDRLGATMYLEVVGDAHNDRFAETLRRRWEHQLTWEVYAASYDRVLPMLPFYQEVVGRHIEAMSASGILTVADLGAGTGNVSIPLLKDGRNVTAVDTSRAMLNRLRAKGATSSRGNLTVLEETVEHLPLLSDESFDGVTILLSCYDMQEPERGIQEALRILRDGGVVVVTEPKQCFKLELLLECAESHLRESGLWEALSDDWNRVTNVNRVLDPGPRASLRSEMIRDRLASAGFVDLTFRDSHLGQCATVMGRKAASRVTTS